MMFLRCVDWPINGKCTPMARDGCLSQMRSALHALLVLEFKVASRSSQSSIGRAFLTSRVPSCRAPVRARANVRLSCPSNEVGLHEPLPVWTARTWVQFRCTGGLYTAMICKDETTQFRANCTISGDVIPHHRPCPVGAKTVSAHTRAAVKCRGCSEPPRHFHRLAGIHRSLHEACSFDLSASKAADCCCYACAA